ICGQFSLAAGRGSRGMTAPAVQPCRTRPAPGGGAGTDVDSVTGYQQCSDLRLRGAEQDKALTFWIDAVDQARLIGAGVEIAILGQRQAKDMILPRAVKLAGLAIAC